MKNEAIKELLNSKKGYINHGMYYDKNEEDIFVIEIQNYILAYQYDERCNKWLVSILAPYFFR